MTDGFGEVLRLEPQVPGCDRFTGAEVDAARQLTKELADVHLRDLRFEGGLRVLGFDSLGPADELSRGLELDG